MNALGVLTNLARVPRNPFFITPSQCAKGALRHLGYEGVVYGHWNHEMQGFFYELGYGLIPRNLMNCINRFIYGSVYLKLLKKKE